MITIAVGTFGSKCNDWFVKLDPAYDGDVSTLDWAFHLAFLSAFMALIAPIMLLPEAIIVVRAEAMQLKSGRRKEYNAPIDIKY